MKQKWKHSLTLLALLAAFFFSCICGGKDVEASVNARKIVLSSKSERTFAGGGITLRVKSVKPSKASKAVTWRSSNKKIATVTKRAGCGQRKAARPSSRQRLNQIQK